MNGKNLTMALFGALQERVWDISADLVGLERSVSHRED